MKWIGQHIWDFISRFRNDVYLEDTSTGTIASGGNLGLDANNKIVKNTITSGPDEDAGDGETHSLKVKKVTITQANFNSLHTTPVDLITAPGANKIIVPVHIIFILDRLKTQSNGLCDLNVHYDLGGAVGGYYLNTYMHFRRFMWQETTDITLSLQSWDVEIAQSKTAMVNKKLQVSVDNEIYGPAGSGDNDVIGNSDMYISYYVLDIS